MDDVIVLDPITIYAGRELPNGDWLHVDPRTEGVLMEVFPADETIETPLSRELLSYDDYAAYREAHPELDLPEFEPPDEEEEEAPIGRQNRSIQSHGGGNTIGRVVGETGATPGPASEANPPVEPETEEEEGFWSRNGEGILDGTQLALDGVGLIPVVGEVADGINALVSLARGDYAGAALSAAAMIPFAGWGATAAKGVRKGAQALEGTAKAGKEVAEAAAEQTARRVDEVGEVGKRGSDGGRIGPRAAPSRKYWNKSKDFKGNKVYQRDDLIDPNVTDKLGRTNAQRMQQGLAPLGPDGAPVNLHHMLQTQDGPIAEVSRSFHFDNYSTIHINPNTIPSGIDRNAFNRWKRAYWKNRALDFID